MKTTTTISSALGLAVLGLSELSLAVVASTWIGRETRYPVFLALFFAMGVPWLVASFIVSRETKSERLHVMLVFGFAVLLRLPFLVTEPVLSDDIFRYVWDGRVQHAGINPYRYAPEAEELRFLRNEDYAGINNKDIPTIYPPLMQVAFFVATSISDTVLGMKAFFVLLDLALLVVLTRLVSTLSLNPARVLVYAWSPLVIVEVAASGHNDVLGALLLIAALWAFQARPRARDGVAMLFLGLSGLAKLVGFALAPLFVRSVRRSAFLAMGVVTLVVCLPYLSAGRLAFRGLSEYGQRWRGNDSLFHLLYALTGSLETAKVLVASILVLLVVGLVALKARPLRSTYLVLGAILLLTTTVHPWYLLWIAPFLAIYPSPAWLYLSLAVALSYHSAYLATPGEPWEDVLWIKALEYVPFFAIGLVSLARRWARGPEALRRFVGLNSSA